MGNLSQSGTSKDILYGFSALQVILLCCDNLVACYGETAFFFSVLLVA